MRSINKLSAKQIEAFKELGRYSDGGNLYLVVTQARTRQWVFRYRWHGKLKELGLGRPGRVSLAGARRAAQAARDNIAAGLDPEAAKRRSARRPIGGARSPRGNQKPGALSLPGAVKPVFSRHVSCLGLIAPESTRELGLSQALLASASRPVRCEPGGPLFDWSPSLGGPHFRVCACLNHKSFKSG